MEKEKISKKQIIPLVIGVLTLVILISSATYAYFRVSVGNTATSTTITGNIGGDTIGTVTLSGGGTNLYLGISVYDMSESKAGTIYYSSTTAGSRETNVNSAGKTTYTATLTGDDSDSVMYACDYEFTVTSSGTALGSENLSDIEVVFKGDINKTLALSSTQKVSGTWYGFKKSNAKREFNAYLQLTNTNSEQNDLAGTNLSVEIKNTKWNCYLDKNEELIGEAYAIYTESDSTLTFVRSETPIKVGDTYNDAEITEVYTGFEEEIYTFPTPSPWYGYASDITNVVFEDEIRPISTAVWFVNMDSLENINLNNLNTSNVTDMSGMFEGARIKTDLDLSGWDVSNVTDMDFIFGNTTIDTDINLSNWDLSNVTDMEYTFESASFESLNLSGWKNMTNISGMFSGTTINTIIGLDSWDTSKVTDMSWMFDSVTFNTDLDLSGWDVSKVTNMSNMFYYAEISTDIGISNWNISNVTNMSSMFDSATFNTDIDLSGWNTSKVTDMSGMFSGTIINTDIDLSGWNVDNVGYYRWFNEVEGSGTLTSPEWKNLYFGVYSETDNSLRIYNDLDIPTVGETYNGKVVTKIYNMSAEGSRPVSCSTTVVPTSIIAEDNIIARSYANAWFSGCTKVNKIDLSKLDTSNVFNMSEMFKNVGSDTSVTNMTITGLESWDTSKVLYMDSMFYNFGLKATYRLDLSGWDVSKITIANNYKDFNYGVTTKVIAPTWNTIS